MATYHKFTALILSAALAACATSQENPNYQYSTQYKGDAPTTSQASYAQPTKTYVSTQTVSADNTITNHDCLRQETNRELIGGAIGGTVGAIAGKTLIGGTKGTLIGAAVGGTAGYGFGDKSINCDPIPIAPAASYPAQSYPQPVPYQSTPATNVQMTAPTDSQYSGQTVTGTPGYMAVQNDTTLTAQPVEMSGGAQAVSYDYSENMVDANSPAALVSPKETLILGRTGMSHYQVQQGDTVYSLARRLCMPVSDIQSTNDLSSNYGIQIGQTLQLPTSRC